MNSLAKSCLKIHMEKSKHTSTLKYLVDGFVNNARAFCSFVCFFSKPSPGPPADLLFSSISHTVRSVILSANVTDSVPGSETAKIRIWSLSSRNYLSHGGDGQENRWLQHRMMAKVSPGSTKQEPFTPCGRIRDFSVERISEQHLKERRPEPPEKYF